LLDDFADQQSAKNAEIEAKMAAKRKAIAEEQARAEEEYAKAEAAKAEKVRIAEEKAAAIKAKREAAAAVAAEARAAEKAAAEAAPAKAGKVAKAVGKGVPPPVVKVDSRAERIKARQEAGEAAPDLFGFK